MTRGKREAVVRGVLLDRDENTVTIVDRLAVDQSVDYESAVITPTTVNPLVPAVSGGAYHLEVWKLTSGLRYRHAVIFDNLVKSAAVVRAATATSARRGRLAR